MTISPPIEEQERVAWARPPESRKSLSETALDRQDTGAPASVATPPTPAGRRSVPHRAGGDIEDIYPLTPMQEGMLFHILAQPESRAYLNTLACRIDGLDPVLFKAAWALVLGRHTALRASFHWSGLEANQQRIHKCVALPWLELDWRDTPAVALQSQLDALIGADRERGLSLDQAPLMHFSLARLGAADWIFIWTQSHLLLDGWSTPIVMNEVFTYYDAMKRGRTRSLKPPVAFRRYIDWLASRDREEARRFWEEALAGFSEPTPLPYGLPSRAEGFGHNDVRLDARRTTELVALTRARRITLNAVIQFSWAYVLARYTGAEDVVFGTTVSGRPPELPGVESIVGLFINTLPVRVDLSGSPTLGEVLDRLHKAQIRRETFAYTPLLEIQAMSSVPHGTPLFESLTVLENFPADRAMARDGSPSGDVTVEVLAGVANTNLPLALVCVPGTELEIQLIGQKSRFASSLMRQMVRHVRDLLGALPELVNATADRTPLLRRLPLMTPAERGAILSRINETAYPVADLTVVPLFEARAAIQPDRPAVVGAGESLTFAELNSRANRLAAFLRTRGAGPETIVAVAFDRSPELLVCLLAILKAGAAYLPLDPDYPSERLAFMLADASPLCVLADSASAPSLPQAAIPIYCPVDLALDLESRSDLNLDIAVTAGNMAYVIYTSGTSGLPKGTALCHGGLANLMAMKTRTFHLCPEDRATQIAAISFDASVFETWPQLAAGACLYPVPSDILAAPASLLDFIIEKRITVAFMPTPLAEEILTFTWPAETALRLLLTGGAKLNRHPSAGLPFTLYNNYGPTENTVWTTLYRCRPGGEGSPPIGRPLDNVSCYVLDRFMEPVPFGVPGELFIGGANLARGYLGRSDLTAERFPPNPFERNGARLYRSGDLVVLTEADSEPVLQFLGRIDFQVKIRGFRIELGEIETLLAGLPGVTACAVLARPTPAGDHQLVAYVQPAADQPGLFENLRSGLADRLPEFMLPAAFVALDTLPMTPNGKIDRKLLAGPGYSPKLSRPDESASPQTPIEATLASLWAEVLKLDRPPGVSDNFFALGGHSLLATRLVSAVQRTCGVNLPIQAVFEHPDIRTLARCIDELLTTDIGQVPPIEPVTVAEPDRLMPLSFAQQRLWFLERMTPGKTTYNLPLVQPIPGLAQPAILARALGEVIRRHQVLRTVFVLQEDEPFQKILPFTGFSLAVVDFSRLHGEDGVAAVRRLARRHAAKIFDLERGPLCDFVALRLDGDRHFLLANMHHIISDGWSMERLQAELTALYTAFAADRPNPLPDLPVQYADFALWQRRWLQGEVLERQLRYWQAHLGDEPSILELPADHARTAIPSNRGATQMCALSAALSQRLRQLARERAASPFMFLLAGFQVLLARFCRVDDFCVGVAVSGRGRDEIEKLIGFFVNTLVLRADTAGNPGFLALLDRVRATVLGAFANQDLPFEKLVETMAVRRDVRHAPLFQVMFALHETAGPDTSGALGGSMTDFSPPSEIAKFELTLSVANPSDGGAMLLMAEYMTDLFEQATIARFLSCYQTLLQAIAAEPDRGIADLPLLDKAERARVLALVTGAETRPEDALTLCGMLAAMARAHPHQVALQQGAACWSYGELAERTDRLAAGLAGLGAGPGCIVAMCLPRSAAAIEAIVATVKSGAAYVAIDPGWPSARADFILADTRAGWLLTQPDLAAGRHFPPALTVLNMDGEWATGAAATPASPYPGNTAYLIYTSGSTGRPKGVPICHRSLWQHVVAWHELYRPTPADRMLQFASFTFDVSVQEVFCALTSGMRLVLREDDMIDPRILVQRCSAWRISILDLPTAVWHEMTVLLDRGELSLPDSLRLVIIGGEAALAERVDHWRRYAGDRVRLTNMYGPTEVTISATAADLASPGTARFVPIGRGLTDYRVFLVDERLQAVPEGVPGELVIGGSSLSRGYLNRPDLTAPNFVPDPFTQKPGARLYRTGDLARVRTLDDGSPTLEFLGRLDFQVKIRGYRIELQEIEAHLRRHEAIADVFATTFERAPGDTRLVAYLVTRKGAEVTTARLSTWLGERLPTYSVPGVFVFLEALPRTAGNKLDRRALPAPEAVSTAPFSAPRGATEIRLAAIWCDLLQIEQVGAGDNFFELGGHSLLATKLVAAVQRGFEVNLPILQVFENARLTAMAACIDALLAEQSIQTPPILPAGAEQNRFPLSFAQQRLWFIERLQPGTRAYNLPLVFPLPGRIVPDLLGRALSEVIRRHQVLRTVFITENDEPLQSVRPHEPYLLPFRDLAPHDKEAALAIAGNLAEEQANRSFDLAEYPLFDFLLLRLDEDHHVLLANLHHIITDGWSMALLQQELTDLYAAFAAGAPSPLAELPVQYGDYARWQRDWLRGAPLLRQLSYWQGQLGDDPPVLELPADGSRLTLASPHGATLRQSVPASLARRLRQRARENDTTLFVFMLASFQVLLARLARAEDFCVGTAISGRGRAEIEKLIGFFVNTLVLRARTAGNPAFTRFLRDVRTRVLGAFDHQDVPFEKLVEELAVRRDIRHTPLFQVMFALVEAGESGSDDGNSALAQAIRPAEDIAKFELTLTVVNQAPDGEMMLAAEYLTDLFEPATISRLLGCFETLLAAIAADPSTAIEDLAILTDDQRNRILATLNDTGQPWDDAASICDLLMAAARRHPTASALQDGAHTWTYSALLNRAQALAEWLVGAGVTIETPVAFCLPRSADAVTAMLGTLLAGGTYVALDPKWPRARTAFILEDSDAPLLLTSEELLAELPPSRARTLILADAWPDIEARATGKIAIPIEAAQIAYLIYTSGSTGVPKGVQVSHGNVVHYVHAWNLLVGPRPGDRKLQFASYTFDVSVQEVFCSLSAGMCLVLRSEEMIDPIILLESCASIGITILHLPTAVWHEVTARIAAGEAKLPACVRTLLIGGEAAAAERVAQWRAALPHQDLWNTYGPTETTISATGCNLTALPALPAGPVPIGGPLANYRAHITDRHLQPVPFGVAGELVVAGPGLARGYLNRPAITAGQFVPDPFGQEPGSRLYRTGDLVRYRDCGDDETTIVFLGRIDFQVKIRGYRIELQEIEAHLRRHEAIADVFATTVERAPGDTRLVAYLVARKGAEVTTAGLSTWLGERLPSYSVPGVFVFLEALPRTAGNKLDRRALPAPEAVSGAPFNAPRGATEIRLAAIWCDLLQIEQVGGGDNFFELGGHSLLATKLVAAIQRGFEVNLPILQVFEKPRLTAMAACIDALRAEQSIQTPPILPAGAEQNRFPLSFAQQRLWFIERLQPGTRAYNLPLVFPLPGQVMPDLLGRALSEVIRRHQVLRTVFITENDEPLQSVRPHEPYLLPFRDLTPHGKEAALAIAGNLAEEQANRSFDLAEYPLFDFLLLRLDEDHHVLLANLHHIITDGWSMELLQQELTDLYAAFAAGAPSPLADLPVQYGDYARWQRDWLQGVALRRQLSYWQGQLGDDPPVLELPADGTRLALASPRGATLRQSVPASLARRLRQRARENDTTLFVFMLASFQVLLARLARAEDFCVGTAISGRGRAEIEKLIGFFVNTLVLRARTAGNPAFTRFLRDVRTRVLGAFDHQDVPFEKLVEELAVRRDIRHTPLFQVMFALVEVGEAGSDDGNSALAQAIRPAEDIAKFELTLTVVNQAPDGEMVLAAEYLTDLFEQATIARFLSCYQTLLQAIAAEPSRGIADLPLLDKAERARVLALVTGAETRPEDAVTLYDMLAAMARAHPHQVALQQGAACWSYGELAERTDRLAAGLAGLGAGPGCIVAMCLPRSPAAIEAIVATAKSGAAYVAIDPEWPAGRADFILADTRAGWLLTQPDLAAGRHFPPALTVLDIDGDWAACATATLAAPFPGNTAYLIYTSGSTGRPKGVPICHRSLRQHVGAWQELYRPTPADRMLQFASFTFDVSVQEVFCALTSGMRLVLREDDMIDPRILMQRCSAWSISILDLPTAVWHELTALLDRGELSLPDSLRLVIIGGEAALAERVDQWCRRAGDRVRLTNMYGPTEVTISATAADLASLGTARFVPIGRGLTDYRVFLVDERLQAVPEGVPGELVIGGLSLSRGYLNRPDLTAASFVPDPFTQKPGARLYRTGDLARVRALEDGSPTLEFLGRIDFQVKIRGYRIELQEIESALLEHGAIDEAYVTVFEHTPGDRRIAAYLAARRDRQPAPQVLAAWLDDRLPGYMVPAAFIFLESLPKTAANKIDRRALPAPEFVSAKVYQPPRNERQAQLAAIWCDLLGVDRVGIDDNFFELGGHSLLATRMVAAVQRAFAVALPLQEIFKNAQLRALAGVIDHLATAGAGPETPAIAPVPERDVYPLSFAQERLWFIERLQPGTTTYNLPLAYPLPAGCEAAHLARALDALTLRHQVLRTVFTIHGDDPVQRILAHEPLSLPLVDLSALDTACATREATRLAARQAAIVFDLETGPLYHFLMLRLADDRHVLLANMHHIVTDGWSMQLLFAELTALYQGFATGNPSSLPALPVQYADFATWQRSHLEGEILDRQGDYWRRQLGGDLPVLELPADFPRTGLPSTRGAAVTMSLPGTLAGALRALARAGGASPFMLMLAAFQVLVSRFGRAPDFCVGTPVSGRGREEIENLIGFFVNTLVLRADTSGNPAFLAYLDQVRTTVLAAFANQDYPFEKLVGELVHNRDLRHTPLFQVMFALHETAGADFNSADSELIEALMPGAAGAKFELTVSVENRAGGRQGAGEMVVVAEYKTDLFQQPSIEGLLAAYRVLLEGIAATPDRPIHDLPLMAPKDQASLLSEWNAPCLEVARQETILSRFATVCRSDPNQVAVQEGDRQWTYAELNERTSRLAGWLAHRGAGPETTVALCLPRSAAAISAILGVLKTGAAYVPLDPDWPAARLAFIIADTGSRLLLTRTDLAARLPASAATVIPLESLAIESEKSVPPAPALDAANLAYLIYTSGSTGQPKGVQISHGSVLTQVTAWRELYRPRPGDRLLQYASVTFDVSVQEIFCSLLSGIRLVHRDEDMIDPRLLVARAAAWGITILNMPTSAWHELAARLATDDLALPGCIRLVIIAGEAAVRERVDQWRSRVDARVALMNMYGPTEITVTCTAANLARLPAGPLPFVPIGGPMPHYRAAIVDDRLHPVPAGVPGELLVGGPGLARGYLNRPDLSAERFVPDAFGTGFGNRLYRTGDLVRRRDFGQAPTLEFLGRLDFQVKVRGYRIELNEIEAVLREHVAVAEAVVTIFEKATGDHQLAAYLVPREGMSVTTAEINAWLSEKLPAYMVPAAILLLATLPLNSSNKIDRRALPAPAATATAAFIAPRNDLERRLADIWRDLLKADRIGIEDNFFELGGHSLMATRLAAAVQRGLGVDLAIQAIFERPAIRLLAEHIDRLMTSGQSAELAPITPVGTHATYPLSFSQQRLWSIENMEPGTSTYNIPMAFPLPRDVDAAILGRAIDETVRRHQVLRTVFLIRDGLPRQHVQPHTPYRLPVADLSTLDRETGLSRARELATALATRLFDLETGPLFEFLLLRLDGGRAVLLANIHHIATDGWSMDLLFRELQTLYTAFAAGKPSPLPELAVQYTDFAHWQRHCLEGTLLHRQLAFWRTQLGGDLAPLELQADYPRLGPISNCGATLDLELPTPLANVLRALARQQGCSLFVLMLAAFQVLISRFSRVREFCVGTPVSGRGRAEIEGLVGFFVNTLVLRANTAGNPSFRDFLDRVRTTVLAALANQDYPFEQLVSELVSDRDLRHSPLFQVMFTLQQASGTTPDEQTEDMIRALMPEVATAKFEVTLTVANGDVGPMRVAAEYKTDLFERQTIEQLLTAYRALLEALTAAPEQAIDDLAMMPPDRSAALVREWIAPPSALDPTDSIPARFAAACARNPHKLALQDGDLRLTYAELDERSDRLAAWLAARGAGPEVAVAMCLPRSAAAVVAMLGILKAGSAYIPLDPDWPSARMAFILDDTRSLLVLTNADLASNLPQMDRPILCLDTDHEQIAAAGRSFAAPLLSLETMAYVIYTSGSTGNPKGVQISHRNLLNQVAAWNGFFRPTPEDRLLQFTAITFDFSVQEIYCSLLNGLSLFHRSEAMLDPRELIARSGEWGITIVTMPTAAWHELADRLAASALSLPASIRLLVMGGEAANRQRVDQWRAQVDPRVAIMNMYGPTETTVTTTGHNLATLPPGPVTCVPIGPPMPHYSVTVADTRMRSLPPGVPGELMIGGSGLARGYLGRPELTAERFVPDPFSGEIGSRVYRTGDLVRRRVIAGQPTIEFLGRMDFQVKVRGYRIELHEIDACLRAHAAVEDAVVTVYERETGERQLVAYVIPGPEMDLATADLTAWLAQKLPAYMVPALFTFMTAFPLNSSGKIDRKALPRPEASTATDFAPPRNDLEARLAALWVEVLGVSRVGIHDSFFELGGDSMSSIRFIGRAAAAGLALTARQLFEHPTVAQLAAIMKEAAVEAIPALPRTSDPVILPLSFGQLRLWFLQQLDEAGSLYNMPSAIRIHGDLQVDRFEAALSLLAQRQEVLRTTVALVDGKPAALLHPPGPLQLPLEDLRDLEESVREARVQRELSREARLPFDLELGLWRVRLLHTGAADYVLFFTMHHMISDGWSMPLFIHELAAFYRALTEAGEASLPDLPIQYADFAAWQREGAGAVLIAEQTAYWQRQLQGVPTLHSLPTDRARPAQPTFAGSGFPMSIDAATTARIKRLAIDRGASLFMTLLAVFKVLLYRLGGRGDIVVGSPIANRDRYEVENLIGFFVNMLALRAELNAGMRFEELLEQVRKTVLDGFANQMTPFEQVVESLDLERNLSHNPLIQIVFAIQKNEIGAFTLPGLSFVPMGEIGATAKFDLSMGFSEADGTLYGGIEYSTDLFDEGTIARMAAHFHCLLAAILDDPQAPLSRLPLVSDDERTPRECEAATLLHTSLHRLFEAQAARTPDAVAVVAAGCHEGLSYAGLDAHANQLAAYLADRGVATGDVVALCMERTPEMIVALLAILKAGAAYLPLDPAWPDERLHFMLVDAGAAHLLANAAVVDLLPQGAPVTTLLVDSQWQSHVACFATAALSRPVHPEHLAYVIYTSGSTGKPKGVAIPHAAVVNFTDHAMREYDLDEADRVLQFAAVSFDTAVEEIYPCLSAGATLVLRDDDMIGSSEALLQACERDRITVLDLPTAFWHQLTGDIGAGNLRLPADLRLVILGGERARPEVLRDWQRACGDFPVLINTYGPTEACVIATCYEPPLPEDWSAPLREIPIGRPITNAWAYLLDSHLQPAPVGVPGELLLAGQGLARGYLARPELTAERFIPNPFVTAGDLAAQGTRLYRTGDLARYLASGDIEFQGRADNQVKIRGFRVELGEIEAALQQHDAVDEAAVLFRANRAGTQQLVAFAVTALSGGELREYLAQRLPAYMVPAAVQVLDAMPLTTSGKLDRRALAAVDVSVAKVGYVPPATDTERALAEIWQQVLGLDRVGIQDNFFEIGGDSILSIQVLARARKIGLQLSPRDVFENQTIARMAAVSQTQGGEAGADPHAGLVTLRATGSLPPLFLVHPVGGSVYCYRELAEELGADQPVFAFQARGLDGLELPRATFEEMAAAYAAELAQAYPTGPLFLGGWSLGGVIAHEMVRILTNSGRQLLGLALFDAYLNPISAEEAGDETVMLRALAVDLEVPLPPEAADCKDADEFLALILEAASAHAGAAGDLTISHLTHRYQVFRANSKALAAFRATPMSVSTLLCHVATLTPETAAAWTAVTGAKPTVVPLQGSHHTILHRPGVVLLAQRLKKWITTKI